MSDSHIQQQITDNIINALVRLDNDAKQPNTSAEMFGKCGRAILTLLNKVESDFGTGYMINVFINTNKQLGHTLGPLDSSIIKKLLSYGFKIDNIKKVCEYEKNIS